MIVPLHDHDAIAHFSVPGGSHVMVGGEAGLAFGPIGRSGEASMLASRRGVDTTVSYSHSRGLYSGITVDGAFVQVRDDVNKKFYGFPVDPAKLFDGSINAPMAAEPLYRKLAEYESALGRSPHPSPLPEYTAPPPSQTHTPPSNYTSFSDMNPSSSPANPNPISPGINTQVVNGAVSMYQSATPAQRQQAFTAASSAYQSLTPEQRTQAARYVYNASTANDDNSVFV